MVSEHPVGSLALLPKRPRVWGDDQTTTRIGKAIAMAVGAEVSGPRVESMRRHRRARRRLSLAAAAVGVAVVVVVLRGAARWLA